MGIDAIGFGAQQYSCIIIGAYSITSCKSHFSRLLVYLHYYNATLWPAMPRLYTISSPQRLYDSLFSLFEYGGFTWSFRLAALSTSLVTLVLPYVEMPMLPAAPIGAYRRYWIDKISFQQCCYRDALSGYIVPACCPAMVEHFSID